ncbi:MAG: tetratricopeptide repeat protein [Deltaproteobacteria bacterium]|nr:tetratricopeptide repeat protein [Deltaproteobacteria bacterium]
MARSFKRRLFLRTGLEALGGLLIGGPFLLEGCASGPVAVPRSYQPKYKTLAHEVLDIEREHNIGVEGYFLLDKILGSARDEPLTASIEDLSPRERALLALDAISNLLASFGFEYDNVNLLSLGLSRRRVNCDGYSVLYLAVGEILGLPIKMVRAPQHTFVRWHLDEKEYINWETTIGQERDDAYYISKHRIAKRTKRRSALRSLGVTENRDEILANAYVNNGVEWLRKCRLKIAINRFNKAIGQDPNYETPYYNIGLTYYHMGEMINAINWCKQAVYINPNHLKSHAVLQSAYNIVGDRKSSKKHLRKVMRLNSSYYGEQAIETRRKKRHFCKRGNPFS